MTRQLIQKSNLMKVQIYFFLFWIKIDIYARISLIKIYLEQHYIIRDIWTQHTLAQKLHFFSKLHSCTFSQKCSAFKQLTVRTTYLVTHFDNVFRICNYNTM